MNEIELTEEEKAGAVCCPSCLWSPLESMREYHEIHGDEARCISCRKPLATPDWRAWPDSGWTDKMGRRWKP